MRKHYFNHLESGYFKKEKRAASSPLSAMGGMMCCVCRCSIGHRTVCSRPGALCVHAQGHCVLTHRGTVCSRPGALCVHA